MEALFSLLTLGIFFYGLVMLILALRRALRRRRPLQGQEHIYPQAGSSGFRAQVRSSVRESLVEADAVHRRPPGVPTPRAGQTVSPSPSTSGRPTTPRQGFPGLDEEIRARVRAQEASEASARSAPSARPTPPTFVPPLPDHANVPTSLPVKAKTYFFARSEVAFYSVLLNALPAERYRVFPNVRLNDIFRITSDGRERQGTYARLRDKHVDFLIVALPDFQPVVAIELDGASHDHEKQQYRDAVKDVAFRSGGLPLLRFRAEGAHTPAQVRQALSPYLRLPAQGTGRAAVTVSS